MHTFSSILMIAIGSLFINNFVLSRFLGLCPFLGVSKKTSSAIGMGIAVVFVMMLTAIVTWLLYVYILLPGDKNVVGFFSRFVAENGLTDVLRTSSYILVIAVMVQFVEMLMKKKTPALYRALGIYLPLITTNCCVFAVALLVTTDARTPMSLLEAAALGFFGGVGFMLALLLMAGIREQLELVDVPKPFRGVPIAFICTSLMALAFMGFVGMG